jgi:hypothetical protein
MQVAGACVTQVAVRAWAHSARECVGAFGERVRGRVRREERMWAQTAWVCAAANARRLLESTREVVARRAAAASR